MDENKVYRLTVPPIKVDKITTFEAPDTSEVYLTVHEDGRKFYNLYFSTDIISMINSWRIRWTGHVARMENQEIYIEFELKSLEGRDQIEQQQQ
jgi:hypothetical protein